MIGICSVQGVGKQEAHRHIIGGFIASVLRRASVARTLRSQSRLTRRGLATLARLRTEATGLALESMGRRIPNTRRYLGGSSKTVILGQAHRF